MSPATMVFLIVPNLALASLICQILLREPRIGVIGEAESYDAACDKLSHCKPDWVILDCSLPDIRGLDAIPKVARLVPSARFILLYDDDDKRYCSAAAGTGAICVRKDHVATDLITAVRTDEQLQAAA